MLKATEFKMNAKGRSIKKTKKKKRQTLARSGALLLGLYLGASFELVLAEPTGGEVIRGEGLIGQRGVTTTISQQSQRLLLEWQTFNVAADENVIFNQPGSTAVALNRILDQNASEILGAIDANGRVFLINPNGIILFLCNENSSQPQVSKLVFCRKGKQFVIGVTHESPNLRFRIPSRCQIKLIGLLGYLGNPRNFMLFNLMNL